MTWQVSQTADKQHQYRIQLYNKPCAYIVKHMLMSRSQLQPVMNAAAAGGNRMATYYQRTPQHGEREEEYILKNLQE